MENKIKKEKLDSELDNFLGNEELECTTEECKIKSDRSLVERINKIVITEDGRLLLI